MTTLVVKSDVFSLFFFFFVDVFENFHFPSHTGHKTTWKGGVT